MIEKNDNNIINNTGIMTSYTDILSFENILSKTMDEIIINIQHVNDTGIDDINETNEDYISAIQMAIEIEGFDEDDKIELITLLVDLGANIHIKSSEGKSMKECAINSNCSNYFIEYIKELIKNY
jgi:hypothetical protein